MDSTSNYFDGDVRKTSRYWDKFRKLEEFEFHVAKCDLLKLKGDTMLVEKLPPVEIKLKSGLVYQGVDTHRGTMADDATEFGLVLAVGPGQYFEDGTLQVPDSKPGDVILLPGNVFWYSQFGHLAGYEAYTIGRMRDSQVPMWFSDYRTAFEILNGVER